MTLRERLNRIEATCQGCRVCAWGGIVPCPTQSEDWHRDLPTWRRLALADQAKRGNVAVKEVEA